MYSKIVAVIFVLACAQALPIEQHYQATSFASFNQHHNTVQHLHSSPAILKAAVAAVPVVHAAPVHVAPVAIKTLSPHSAQSYSSLSLGHSSAPVAHYSAPIAIAQPAIHAAPVLVKSAPIAVHHEEQYAPAKYEFAYGVEDHHTGDIHSQKERRDGDLTQGEYSLHEADGTIRTVKYTVDKHSGFNAVVERTGHAVHAQPAPAKAIYAAPIGKSVVLGAVILLACAHAHPIERQYHQATSFASFNEHRNTVHHIHSTPAILKTSAAFPLHVPQDIAPVTVKTLVPQASAQSPSISHAAAPFAKLVAPVATHSSSTLVQSGHHEEEHGPAKYEFEYGIEDHHTGDIHSQKESRDGDLIRGEYSLHEADGTIRTVKYTVDKHSGFKAVVERSRHAVHT
ncbi:cuticle protein-like [Anoplophora glabripennis]|uniref:cuticle protein-like n=1 Tax=Anoplophora glabripennis TaxID=217634 RepID=UPI000C788817|nr:cuticle protein-like [Anoplophora glabripennis]